MDAKHITDLQKVNTMLGYLEAGIKCDKNIYVNDWPEVFRIISPIF